LVLASRTIAISFGDANSVAAVSVRRRHVPGENPEEAEAHRISEVWAVSGSIRVQENEQQHQLQPGQKLVLFENQPAHLTEVGPLPTWVTGDGVSDVDRSAAQRLQPALKPDRPISLALQERVEDRRYDVRALAVRCLGYLDQFDALVKALDDPDQRSYWNYHIDVLREALTRGPAVAAQVRLALEKKHGAEARPLYEMLWGYSPEQLQAGAAKKLVDYLSHASLDYRVLAFENLKEITGGTSLYRPWLPAARRRPGVFRWREQLDNGQIKYKTKPEILELLDTDLET
jgi:hypothetical protein